MNYLMALILVLDIHAIFITNQNKWFDVKSTMFILIWLIECGHIYIMAGNQPMIKTMFWQLLAVWS